MKNINFETIAFHITEACEHHCAFCYANTSIRKKHIPLETIKKTIDKLVSDNVKINEVTLLGGDPALHPNIIEIAEYFHKNNIKVAVLSNTHNYSDLKKALQFIDAFETTIHSDKVEDHDDFCGVNGAYLSVTEKLSFFSKNKKEIGIAVNITPQTYSKIYNIITNLLKKNINIKYIIFQRIIPFGRAIKTSKFTTTREQIIVALRNIQKLEKEFKIKIIIEDPVPICILPEDLIKYIHPCQWGLTKVSMNGYGELSRCGADPRNNLGNIFEKPLSATWNDSAILKSFRNKKYLPGRCQSCEYLLQCGGGCPLSCEIEKDHGIDYLFEQYETHDIKLRGNLSFKNPKKNELSSLLQIEWSNFADYGHMFSVESIQKWYNHNNKMFWVVKDKRNWILGYAVIVPIHKDLYDKILAGKYSSLTDFPIELVLKNNNSAYFHIEVIASVLRHKATRVGSYLIKQVGKKLLSLNAKYITTSPIKNQGEELCKYFDFKHVSDEIYNNQVYPIYTLKVNKEQIMNKIEKF